MKRSTAKKQADRLVGKFLHGAEVIEAFPIRSEQTDEWYIKYRLRYSFGNERWAFIHF